MESPLKNGTENWSVSGSHWVKDKPAICLVKSGVEFVVKTSGHFRASFPEERGTANFTRFFMAVFTALYGRKRAF